MLNAAPIHEQLAKVVAALQAGDHFLIVGHVDPDPDCLGSMLALHWALQKLGKSSLPVVPDQIPTTCRFLPGVEHARLPQDVNPLDFNVLVVVDCEPGRTGPVAVWLHHFTQIVNIDHHVTNSAQVPTTYLDPKAAAAGEMVHAIIKALGLHLDQEVATLLYTAIMADTGSFRFSNTNARVLQVGAELIEMGANPDLIAQQIYETHSWGYLQLLQRVLSTLARSSDGKIAWITVTADMLSTENVRRDETEGLVQYPRMIEGVEVALVFREIGPSEVRVGFRSRTDVDVSVLARQLGGGGHPRAAGCTLHMPLATAPSHVLPLIQQALMARVRV